MAPARGSWIDRTVSAAAQRIIDITPGLLQADQVIKWSPSAGFWKRTAALFDTVRSRIKLAFRPRLPKRFNYLFGQPSCLIEAERERERGPSHLVRSGCRTMAP